MTCRFLKEDKLNCHSTFYRGSDADGEPGLCMGKLEKPHIYTYKGIRHYNTHCMCFIFDNCPCRTFINKTDAVGLIEAMCNILQNP